MTFVLINYLNKAGVREIFEINTLNMSIAPLKRDLLLELSKNEAKCLHGRLTKLFGKVNCRNCGMFMSEKPIFKSEKMDSHIDFEVFPLLDSLLSSRKAQIVVSDAEYLEVNFRQ